jgi:hypothetical protein
VRCCQFNHRRQSVLCSILIRLNFPSSYAPSPASKTWASSTTTVRT